MISGLGRRGKSLFFEELERKTRSGWHVQLASSVEVKSRFWLGAESECENERPFVQKICCGLFLDWLAMVQLVPRPSSDKTP